MYNQDIKERYLETRVSSVQNEYRNYFEVSSKIEEMSRRDVACFSVDEIDAFLSNYGFCEPHTVRNRVAKLSSYSSWYIENIQPCENHYKRYDIARFPYSETLKPTLIYSSIDLSNRILQVYDADSGQTAIPVLCLAWLGIDNKTALALKKSQVDTERGKIYDATGGIIVNSMDEEIRELLHTYGKTQSAIRTQNRTFEVYADDRGYFLKRFVTANSKKVGKPISTIQLSEWVGELRDQYAELFGDDAAMPLTYSNVLRSGGLSRLRELELSGVQIKNTKNSDRVSLCFGDAKRSHKDNMIMYDAYLECIGEK